MAESNDRLDAARSIVSQARSVTEASVLTFLREQPELSGRPIRVVMENSDVKAGMSAGLAFFTIEDSGNPEAKHCGRYVARFEVGEQRLFRQGSLRNQFDLMRALRARGLRVPDAVWLDESGVLAAGNHAIVMRRIEAQAPHLLYMQDGPYVSASPEMREVMLRSVLQFSAQQHALPLDDLGLDFLRERGGSGAHFIDREINWILAEVHSRFPEVEEGERAPLLGRVRKTCDFAANWLRERAPRHRQPVLVHGDFTLANIFFEPDGTVAAVLDWELTHEGLPEEDVSWLSLAARGSAIFYGSSIEKMPSISHVRDVYRSVGGQLPDIEYASVLTAFRLISIAGLALRIMPKEFWPTQPQIWDQQEAMLFEAIEAFERREGAG